MKFEEAQDKLVELLEKRGNLSIEYDDILDSFSNPNSDIRKMERRMEEINEEMMEIDCAIYDLNDTMV